MDQQQKTDNWYRDVYLKSEHWRKVAKERLELDGYRCQMCGSEGTTGNPLQVHHWNYKDLGHEDVATSVVSLCDCCHLQLHRLLMRPTSADGTNARIKNPNVPNCHVYTITGETLEKKLEALGRNDRKDIV